MLRHQRRHDSPVQAGPVLLIFMVLSATFSGLTFAGGFSPTSLSGLDMWLNAEDITGLSSGDPVSTWPDSFNINDAIQSDLDKQPRWIADAIGDMPVVRFDGSNDVLNSASLSLGSDTTVFFLTKNSPQLTTGSFHRGILTAANNPYRVDGDGYGLGYQRGNVPGFGISLGEGAGGASEQRFSHALGPDDAFEAIAYRKSGGSAELFRNNFSTAVASGTQNDPVGGYTTGYNIGADASLASREYQGDIAEIIVYNRALSDTELSDVGAYLDDKWLSGPPPVDPPPTPKGLVSYWNFDDGTTADDQFGDNDGITFQGGATHSTDAPPSGGANSLDLTNGKDYVTLPSTDYGITNEYTISAWVKRNGTGSGRFFAAKRDLTSGGGDRSGVALGLSGSEVYAGLISDAIGGQTNQGNSDNTFHDITTTGGVDVPESQWTHVAVTLQHDLVRVYVDGVAETVYASGGGGPTTGELKVLEANLDLVDANGSFSGFGADGRAPAAADSAGDFTTSYYDGLLDEVAVWNIALSGDDIATLAAGGSPLLFIPEPSSVVLLLCGLIGLSRFLRRRVRSY